MALTEKPLGQVRPSDTTAVSIYSPGASVVGTVKSIEICNTSSGDADYRIFLDADGTTYDEGTALRWDITVPVKGAKSFNVWWPLNNSSGNIAVRTSVANALTFTFLGFEVDTS